MSTEKKTNAEKLADKLLSNNKHAALRMDDEEIAKAFEFCESYKAYLDAAKTERESVIEAVKLAKAHKFTEFKRGKKYKVQLRAYKKVDGKTFYGQYSKSKKIKIK